MVARRPGVEADEAEGASPEEPLPRRAELGAETRPLGRATFAAAYIPDFPLDEVQYWFVPDRARPESVYPEFLGRSAEKWDIYYNKRGWKFVHHLDPSERRAEGPFWERAGVIRPRILKAGRIFAPRPQLIVEDGASVPILGIEKRRPINPWKPTYIKALNFIKKYEWPHPLPGDVESAVFEVEECGEIAGSTSWQNAEMILHDHMSEALRSTLVDLFSKRPEEFPLGSEVYLQVLGSSGDEGFELAAGLHCLPQARKRKHVAVALGKLGRSEGVETLFNLLDDEDTGVCSAALRALGRLGVPPGPRAEQLRGLLAAEPIERRVWAAGALLKGGDDSQRKFLITLVKEEENRPLHDMGELGELLAELEVAEAAPYLVQRLKSENSEIRADAAEALRLLTGLAIEVLPGDEESRRQAIRACTRWWEETKERRRSTAREG